MHAERALETFKAITRHIHVSREFSCLDYGSGTGLLSFHFQPLVKSITLVDTSEGMLRVAKEKIESQNIKNMKTLMLDITSSGGLGEKFDLIYALMALHHADDTKKIISVFQSLLLDGGVLCVADLVEEDGSFHEHHANFMGHNGFNVGQLSKIAQEAGFTKTETEIYYSIERQTADGRIKSYPLFLLVCRKNQ